MVRPMYRKASADMPSPGFLCFLVFILPSFCFSQSPLVRSITVSGVHAFSPSELLGAMETAADRPFQSQTFQRDLERIRAHYRERGYLFAAVVPGVSTTDDSQAVALTLTIDENKPAVVEAFTIEGDSSLYKSDLLSSLQTRTGATFIEASLENDIKRILDWYERSGFPLARVSVEDVSFSPGREHYATTVHLHVDKGPRASVEELRIEGNKSTKDFVILREVRLGDQQSYNSLLGEQIRKRLQRLQLFSSVSEPEFYLTGEGKGGLLIQVQEGNPNRFDGIVGYVPGKQSGEQGFLTGLVDVQLRNLLGTGRKLATRWAREDRVSQEISLRYVEPWVGSFPVNASLGFFQRKQDSTYVRRIVETEAALMVTEEFSLGLTFGQTGTFPSSRAGNPVGESDLTNVGLSLVYDSRDDAVTPAGGALYRTTYEVGFKSGRNAMGDRWTDRTGRLSFDVEAYSTTWKRQVLAFALHGRDFRSSIIEQSDLFRLGGANTLRGYREAQFAGSSVIWSNLEYRFLVGVRSFVYGFTDVGYIGTLDRPLSGLTKSYQTKVGLGVGLRMDTSLGLIGISLALGEGDTFSTAKLHMRLVNEF